MENTYRLSCVCGAMGGNLRLSSGSAIRVICHCDDCQTYGHFLRASRVLDSNGGTEVIQSWPRRVIWDKGLEHLKLVRLAPQGMYRFYADCCRAPLANAVAKPTMPFIGLIAQRVVDLQTPQVQSLLGPACGVQGRFVLGGCPSGIEPRAKLRTVVSAAGLLAKGFVRRESQPHPFFDKTGASKVAAKVLTLEERKSFRPAHLQSVPMSKQW